MGSFVPGEGKEWVLLILGFVAGYYIVGHRRVSGKSIPGTAM